MCDCSLLSTPAPEYRPFFSFKDAAPADKTTWCDSFLFFLRKLTVRHGRKRLLLKSPVHTGRVKLLLELFPKAQFIYVHRDPYTVFKSACNMADKTYWCGAVPPSPIASVGACARSPPHRCTHTRSGAQLASAQSTTALARGWQTRAS